MSERDDMLPPDEPLGPDEEGEVLAAEYVLRLLDPAAEAEARAREADDPAFAKRVARWRAEFSALDAEVVPVQPSDLLRRKVERRLFGGSEALAGARPGVGLWQAVAAVFAAATVALGLLVFRADAPPPVFPDRPPVALPQTPPRLVTTLDAADGRAAFIVVVDQAEGTLQIARTVDPPPTDAEHQLWFLDDSGVPESLGLLPDAPVFTIGVDPDTLERLREGVLMEVTREPAGGSPTGGPTGTVIGIGSAQPL